MEKILIDLPIVVEGKYDKIKLSSLVEAQIVTTDGFGLFKSDEKKLLFRRLAEPKGLIVLTDSDGAGLVIRNYFKSILPEEKLIHLYIPRVRGKEKRKMKPGKEGLLGVEGIDADLLRKILSPYATDRILPRRFGLTKAAFYADGFSGRDDSAEKRKKLAEKLGLPDNLSANALLGAINLLLDEKTYQEVIQDV